MTARVKLQNQLGSIENRRLSLLLWPLLQVKRIFDALYQTFLALIWSELTGRPTLAGPMQLGALFLLFCGLSLIIFYLRAYEAIIFLALVGIWWCDHQWARWQYHHRRQRTQVTLTIQPEVCLYRLSTPGQHITHRQFHPDRILQIWIARTAILGGAFQSAVAERWRVTLYLQDHSQLRMYEESNPRVALRHAQTIAAALPGTPVKFVDSTGNSPYAVNLPKFQLAERYHRREVPDLQAQRIAQGWQLRTQWSHASFKLVLRRLFESVGFLLFVLLVTEGMENFGALLHGSALLYSDQEATRLMLIEAVRQLNLTPDWPDLAEAAIALGVVLLQLVKLFRDQSLVVTAARVTYRRNQGRATRLSLSTLQPPLMIAGPFPMVLLLGETKGIAFTGLNSDEWLYGAWTRLQAGLAMAPDLAESSASGAVAPAEALSPAQTS
ncbi:MAG: hypothetical protein O3A14_01570 [Cyanobacteria bacterium]|nr:hypothetical protein [Cyanobacteriota bacterium]